MPLPPAIEALANVVKGYLRISEGAREFIRDDLPSNASGFSKYGQEALRRVCRKNARSNSWDPTLVPGKLIWSDLCNPYLDSINEGPTSQGNYGSPFTGGQCSNKNYIVYATMALQGTDPQGCQVFNNYRLTTLSGLIGPIKGIRYASSSTQGQPIECAWLQHGQNQEFNLGCRFLGCSRPFFSNLTVSLVGPGTDNCGNPPSTYTPPSYPTNLPTLPPPTNPAPGLGNGWDVTVNPDGTFKVCMGTECTPNINPDGSGPDTGEDPGEPDGSPQANNPNNPNNNRIAGCVGTGKILTGIKVTFTQVPTNVSGPLDYYRNVAIIGFGPDSQKIDLVADGKLMIDGQFVIPDSDYCRCYQLDVTPGWGLSVQAYSRPEKTE